MPGTNLLTQELLTIPGIPDSAGYVAMIVNDVFNGTPAVSIGTTSLTITRKPAGSAASVTSLAWTGDLTGYYPVSLLNAGLTRVLTGVVFPASVLTIKVRPQDPNSPFVTRTTLNELLRDPRISLVSLGNALEIAVPNLNLILGGAPVSWATYAQG